LSYLDLSRLVADRGGRPLTTGGRAQTMGLLTTDHVGEEMEVGDKAES
jgi:hypothetical protein